MILPKSKCCDAFARLLPVSTKDYNQDKWYDYLCMKCNKPCETEWVEVLEKEKG